MAASNRPLPDDTPFRPGPFRLTMGLTPLDINEWIEPDMHLAADLDKKSDLLRHRYHEVFSVLPEAADSAAEVLDLLINYLPVRFPDRYQRLGDQLCVLPTGQQWHLKTHTLHPLDLAGRLVQEDLCLMQQTPGTDLYRLVGASVCFPTRWRLTEKIGQSVWQIHDPVPGYAQQLGSTMDRFFVRLKTDRPVWRINWSLMDDPELFQPCGHGRSHPASTINATNAGDMLWLRMERQTLRRLPRTGDILFTIRIYTRPLHDLATQPEQAAHLAAAIRALPPDMQRYKSLPPFLEAVLAWLDRVTMPPTIAKEPEP